VLKATRDPRASDAGRRPHADRRAGCWRRGGEFAFHLSVSRRPAPVSGLCAPAASDPRRLVGFVFRAFDCIGERLSSRVSECLDVAKASTIGVLVLVAIMTFAFRGTTTPRLVIVIFWATSVAAVASRARYSAKVCAWRAATAQPALRGDRRGGEPPPRCCACSAGDRMSVFSGRDAERQERVPDVSTARAYRPTFARSRSRNSPDVVSSRSLSPVLSQRRALVGSR